ncbi:hypothetical protein E1264_03795 [Actinomadura sp. KC216]|uniref:hypothetical protein n=1 Tax=Actinomadura sp. KC216 TaxID=2530370 RepID=UPI001045ABDA|nr:hypothetical protein [Actinomadura sp. KC216]TDB90938.1 hypothetical protein E1264_03795 [Actinomadura sp. KC216]
MRKPLFETRDEVASKVDWEGGFDGALSWGIKVEDLPEDDTELREAWAELRAAFLVFDAACYKVSALLDY